MALKSRFVGKFFFQIAQNIKKKDFIFSNKPSPKASKPCGVGRIILLYGAKSPSNAPPAAFLSNPIAADFTRP
jgi:hypothetical protein